MTNRFDIEKLNHSEKVDYLPKNRGAENPIRKKIHFFLSNFEEGEIRKITCASELEARTMRSRIAYYASELKNKDFQIAYRSEAEGEYVFIKRKESEEENNGSKELHNVDKS